MPRCLPLHRRYYQPENEDDVAAILTEAHRDKKRVRVVGSALSPNAIGFSDDAMMSMALLDNILDVDTDKMQVMVATDIWWLQSARIYMSSCRCLLYALCSHNTANPVPL